MFKKINVGIAITAALFQLPAAAAQGQLASAPVRATSTAASSAYDGVVEAVRQTAIASQVAGAVVGLTVQAGDSVRAGQVLVRLDARAAAQNTAASQAQVQAARAALDVAIREVDRQRKLYEKNYISQSALDRAEAQFRATSAQVKAQVAQASAAGIESGFYVVKAPYAGIVSEVPVQLGDMALPGRPLLTMYDPSALRVTASVPQSAISRIESGQPVRVELPGMPAAQQWLTRPSLQVLPVIDAGTHSAQVRVDLPAGLKSLAPGMFARVWLATGAAADGAAARTGRLFVPATAVVRRAEMTGLYVLDAKGRPLLRQVRLGRATNGAVEVLSGLAAGERVALNPQAAAKGRP